MDNYRYVDLGDSLNVVNVDGGLVNKGEYNAATNYAVGDAVSYNGSSYVMYVDAAAGTAPTNTTYWQLLAAKGDTGAAGATGPQGATGPAGPGVPVGGTAGQILSKIDATNYNTEWVDNHPSDLRHYVKNDSGGTINKGEAVYISGANGTNVLVKKALANSDTTSARTLGLAATTMTTNQFGWVVEVGELTGLDTSAAGADGDPIFLSGTVAGGLIYGIANKPKAPTHLVYIGVVVKKNPSTGEIWVKVQNGYELDEIHDVQINSIQNNQVIKYDSSDSLWKNHTLVKGDVGLGDVTNNPQIINGTSIQTDANFAIQSASTTIPTGLIKARASQTSQLLEFQSSAGNTLAYIDINGGLRTPSIVNLATFNNARIQPTSDGTLIDVGSSDNVVLRVRGGTAPQTKNLQEWQDSSSNVLASVTSNGTLFDTKRVVVSSTLSSSLYSNYLGGSIFATKVNDAYDNAGLNVIHASNTANGDRPIIGSVRARGTLSSPSAVQSGDDMFSLMVAGYDGSALAYPSLINFTVDGTVSSQSIPTRMDLMTGSSNSDRAARISISPSGLIGLGTTAPTHTLTLPSTSTGIRLYNTADQVTNYERGGLFWNSNILYLRTQVGGSATSREIRIQTNANYYISSSVSSTSGMLLVSSDSNATSGATSLMLTPNYSGTSGIQYGQNIAPAINQSGTAGYTALRINPTETTTGSGAKLLIDAQVGGTTKFKVENDGDGTFSGSLTASNLSGTNTGDEDQTSIKTKLGAASTSTDGYLTSTDWNTFNNKQANLGYTPEDIANKSTNTSLGTSNTLYPTQNAVKTYADNLIGNANAVVYKGTIDCSTNPNYPAANAGDLYIVSVAGKIGGASGINVEVGDLAICNTDGTASGNEATVGQYWNVIQKNIDGAVTGPASSTSNNVAFFDGTTGKVIKDSGLTLSGSNTGDEDQSSIKTKLGAATTSVDGYLTSTDWNTFNNKQADLGFTPEDVANKDTDNTLSADSDTNYPSQKAIKSYVDTSQTYMVTNTTGSTGGGTLSLFSDITGLEIYDSGVGITTDVTMAMDSDYAVSTEHAVKTYVDTGLATKIENVVEDTTPQLGGNLDLNGKALTIVATAGENLVAGNLCYLKSDGKYWKASNTSVTTASSKLVIANATINADATGEFIAWGSFTTTGLVAGSVYFVGASGGITTTTPTTEDYVVRPIGTASSTTTLEFNPSTSWISYKA